MFICFYCFTLDGNKSIDFINDRNEVDKQNDDCNNSGKMNVSVICGEFPLNIIKFLKYSFRECIVSVAWKFVSIFLH